MTLAEFLTSNTINAVEVLPDSRLINVVASVGSLHGVEVIDIPSNVPVTRITPITVDETTITAGSLTFTIADYKMITPPERPERPNNPGGRPRR